MSAPAETMYHSSDNIIEVAYCEALRYISMATSVDRIKIEPENIGRALKDKILWVPPNQRDYSWKEKHVEDLYNDLGLALDKKANEYFLGSIVVIRGDDARLLVVDGQQRLATALILLAAIRDFHDDNGADKAARTFEKQYILTEHYLDQDPAPHLHLNERDREYFLNRVLRPKSDDRRKEVEKPSKKPLMRPPVSYRLIDRAAKIAAKRVQEIVKGWKPENQAKKLDEWVEFLNNNAKVIWVEVPDESSAYLIFETMNDRGLELSASDLIKNYLFGRAGQDRLETVKLNWTLMVGALDTVARTEVKDYVRHYWVSRNGVVRTQELFDAIRKNVKNEVESAELSDRLAKSAVKYVSLLNPVHTIWNQYSQQARKAIVTLNVLGVEQTRPLLLAALEKLSAKEMSKLLVMAISWSVRLLIGGIQGSGAVETVYGNTAKGVSGGSYTTAEHIASQILKVVPGDQSFEASFSEANVSKSALARYYLQALESFHRNESDPYLALSDVLGVNLEHIMPETQSDEWKHIPVDIHEEYSTRIGNQALMKVTVNSKIGSRGYVIKKPELAASEFHTTKLASKYSDWGVKEIEDHQRKLAELAIKTWPLKLK